MRYWVGRFACRWLRWCSDSCRGRDDHTFVCVSRVRGKVRHNTPWRGVHDFKGHSSCPDCGIEGIRPAHTCSRPSQAQEMTLTQCACGRSWLAMEVSAGYVTRWRDVTATCIGRVWASDPVGRATSGDTNP